MPRRKAERAKDGPQDTVFETPPERQRPGCRNAKRLLLQLAVRAARIDDKFYEPKIKVPGFGIKPICRVDL